MASSGGRKPRKDADELLAQALAQGHTQQQAAAAAHVSPRTVSRRMESAEFKMRVAAIRAELLDRTAGIFASAMAGASQRLLLLVRDSTNEAIILAASRSVLDYGVRFHELTGIEARLAALEAKAAAGDKGRGKAE